MKHRKVVGTDNRDTSTTVLYLDDNSSVEVDPCDLFMNALSNAGMTQQQFDKVLDALDNWHRVATEVGAPDPDFMNGLGKLVDALRLPGYEFT